MWRRSNLGVKQFGEGGLLILQHDNIKHASAFDAASRIVVQTYTLNEDLPYPYTPANLTEPRLHRLASPQDRDTANLALETYTMVGHALL